MIVMELALVHFQKYWLLRVIYCELWKYVNWSGEEGIKTVKKTFANFDRYNLPQNATKNSTICTIVIMVVEF